MPEDNEYNWREPLIALAVVLVIVICCAAVSCKTQDDPDYKRFVPWMAEVRRLAPRYGYKIEKDDEAWEEWFWLYYFLDGYSPRRALAATRAYDKKLKSRGRGLPDHSSPLKKGIRPDQKSPRPLGGKSALRIGVPDLAPQARVEA